jgi:DnaJ-class molecular chaperone
MSYKITVTCPKCGGGGVFPFEFINGDGVSHPPVEPQQCDMCSGVGKIDSIMELDNELTTALSDIKDVCDDILDKCNDIFEKLNET